MPPGSTNRPLASISRAAPSIRSARATMRPSRMPISPRNSSLAVTMEPPRIARSNCVMLRASSLALERLFTEEPPPVAEMIGIDTCDLQRAPQRRRHGIEDQHIELPLELSGNAGAVHVGAKDYDGIAAVPHHRTDHVGDRGWFDFAERE